MSTIKIVREEIVPGSLIDFRALMHEILEFQEPYNENNIYLRGENTPPDYPKNKGRWEVTLGGTLQIRGLVIARQLFDGNTQLQFVYSSKFQPIGPMFHIEFADMIVKKYQLVVKKSDILLITVTKVESEAVISVSQELTGNDGKTKTIADRVYHDLGNINGKRVFLLQSEMGSSGLGASQQTIQKGISAVSPTSVIMVGIAFGIDPNKQAIGDILVSQQIMQYELQRVENEKGKSKIILRGDRPHASSRLINKFKSADLYWDDLEAKIQFGTILSGDKLVDNIDFRQQLQEFQPEAIGGEMEGLGLYVACQDKKVDWILVKAICDWADGQKSQEKFKRQKKAANNAAKFVLSAINIGK